MRLRLLAPALLVASMGVASLPRSAFADPSPQDIAQARELGGQAQAAFDGGNLAESEKLWIAASSLYPAAPTLTLGLARTQAKLGKLVLAQESYNKIIREQGEKSGLSGGFKDALESAKAEIGAVASRIANVIIIVEGAPNPQVTLDNQPVSAAGLGLKRPIDPGPHVLKAEAVGYKPAETSFQVNDAGLAETKLTLEKITDTGKSQAGPLGPHPAGDNGATVSAAPSSGTSSNKTLALVAFGVGGAGLVVGTITGLIAIGKHGDLEKTCQDGKCPNTLQSDVDSYSTMGTISTIGFIVAGVGAAAGAVLWLTAPSEKTGASSWHPYIGVGSAGVGGKF